MKLKDVFLKNLAGPWSGAPEVLEDGTKAWYRDGKLHREDGPAVERPNGSKAWYRDGQMHREDGPAFEGADGTKMWYRNGKRHREDGPALERLDGAKEWWHGDERLTPDQVHETEAALAENRARDATILAKDLDVLPAININKRRLPIPS